METTVPISKDAIYTPEIPQKKKKSDSEINNNTGKISRWMQQLKKNRN